MLTVPTSEVPALRPWFAPEQPGPLLYEHVARTGHGVCRVDRWPDPRVVLVELPGGNYSLRGDPSALTASDLDDVVGYVEAPQQWSPGLYALDPGVAVWDRVVATLPGTVPLLSAPAPTRRLTPSDAGVLAALSPDIAWIHVTWGGVAGLLASESAHAVFVDGRPVAVAVPFSIGGRYEDIGVVTEAEHRGRGLSTACAAAVVADIRGRGRTPSWSTSPDNAASLAIAARLGFVHARDDVLYAVRTPIPH